MKKPTEHKKLSLKSILKRHASNPKDKEIHEVIESDGDDSLKQRFNMLLQKVSKPSKS